MITVITGPPCSGKTTYAREHAKPGDAVVDYDALAVALGSADGHDHQPRLREITAAAWSAAVERLVTGYPAMAAWIVDSRPTTHRQFLYRRAHARIVALDAPAAELHRRADADGRGQDAHKRIDEWSARHPADPAPLTRTRWLQGSDLRKRDRDKSQRSDLRQC
jgi:predicted kinase